MRAIHLLHLVPVFLVLAGCVPCGGGPDCPDPEPVIAGSYVLEVRDVEEPGTAVLDETHLVLNYTDADGNTWEVVYERGD